MAAPRFLFRGVNNGGAMNLLAGEAQVKKKIIIIIIFSIYIYNFHVIYNTTILYNNLKKILTFERSLRQQSLDA